MNRCEYNFETVELILEGMPPVSAFERKQFSSFHKVEIVFVYDRSYDKGSQSGPRGHILLECTFKWNPENFKGKHRLCLK